MPYVDDLELNSFSELFYMPGQYNSFHTESNTINPYYLPETLAVRYRHPLDDQTGAWKRLVEKGAKNFARNPGWVEGANDANDSFPPQLPFTSYTDRPTNMPNVNMFGHNALVNETLYPGHVEKDFIMEQPELFKRVQGAAVPLAGVGLLVLILFFL